MGYKCVTSTTVNYAIQKIDKFGHHIFSFRKWSQYETGLGFTMKRDEYFQTVSSAEIWITNTIDKK